MRDEPLYRNLTQEMIVAAQGAIMEHPHYKEGGSVTAFGFANAALKAAFSVPSAPAATAPTSPQQMAVEAELLAGLTGFMFEDAS